jgi:hypothetical protein
VIGDLAREVDRPFHINAGFEMQLAFVTEHGIRLVGRGVGV